MGHREILDFSRARIDGSGRMKKTRGAVLLIAIVLMALFAAGASAASTVTIGSPLTATWIQVPMCGSTCTEANTKIGESGAQLAAPSDGTIVRWRLDDSAGTFRLLVLRPDGSGHFSAVAISPAQTPAGPGIETFPADIPIQAGDLIGLNNEESSAEIGYAPSGATGSQFTYFSPQLVVGSNTSTSSSIIPSAENEELAFNADVESGAVAPAPLPAPILAPPAPTCKVPSLRGKKLKAAKKKLVAADCKLGKVKKKGGVTAKTGKVKKQGKKTGSVLPAGTKVNVTLG